MAIRRGEPVPLTLISPARNMFSRPQPVHQTISPPYASLSAPTPQGLAPQPPMHP